MKEELEKIEDIFVANGYNRETVKRYMEDRKKETDSPEEEEKQERERTAIMIPYLKGFSEQPKRIAQKHSFKVAFRPGRKIREIKSRCHKPLGEKQRGVVYRIPF